MVLIIHGNDLTSSRNFYFEEKNKTKNPVVLNGDGLTYEQIFQAAENKTFFSDKVALLIENFFTKNKANSIEFKKIISYVNSKPDIDIIFWESSELNKSTLISAKNYSIKAFSFPKTLFAFLDNIKPGNGKDLVFLLHELEKNMEIELIFFMIIRQFRLLLSQLETSNEQIDEAARMAPWQTAKLKKQLSLFNTKDMNNLYKELFEIEINQKTGKYSYSLEKSIDFFLLGL